MEAMKYRWLLRRHLNDRIRGRKNRRYWTDWMIEEVKVRAAWLKEIFGEDCFDRNGEKKGMVE